MDVSIAPKLKVQVGSFKGSKWDWECMWLDTDDKTRNT
jgi:hypothetical protein